MKRTGLFALTGAVALLLLVSTIHQLGTGLVVALVPIRLAIEGFAAWVAGAMSASFSVGFLGGCLAAPFLVARVPVRTAIAGCCLVNAACAAALWLLTDPLAWCVSRLVAGFFNSCLWVVIEAWLGARSTARNRGTIFGAYMLTSRLSFVVAQVGLAWMDPRIAALFLLAAAFYAISWLPAIALAERPPSISPKAMPRVSWAVRYAPAASVGALIHGMITTAQPTLLPIYAVGRGMGMDSVALGLAAIQFGGLLLQLPLAMASDRWGRRTIMALASLGTAVFSLATFYAPVSSLPLFLAVLAAWGGMPAVLYSLAIAHANDGAEDHQRVALSSSLLMLWGVGATLGPMLASILMDGLAHGALFAFTGALALAFVGFLVWRKLARKPPPVRAPLGGAMPPPA